MEMHIMNKQRRRSLFFCVGCENLIVDLLERVISQINDLVGEVVTLHLHLNSPPPSKS